MNNELLEKVCNIPGIPGFEDPIQEFVMGILKPNCDEAYRDRMGNVIGLKKARKQDNNQEPLRVILAAHADEIGMMVKHIDGDGFIRFAPVGGLNPQAIVSQRVIIHGRKSVNGVIVPTSGDRTPALKDMLIDTGLPGDEVRKLIEVGDVITFAQELVYLNEKVYMSRNFDDRLGTYCMLEAVKNLGETCVDVYAVSTVQEEKGVRGMPIAAFAIKPDMGIAIDGSPTWGAHVSKVDNICAMGQGTGIYLMDGLTIGDRRLVKFLFDLCEKYDIPYQRNIGGGTDASAIQRTGIGALATTIGAPTRYMHSTVQLAHGDDIEATVKLLVKFLENAHELGVLVR
ncbi:M42 family peptidase [Candidatus Poribacteria bacterium]|nr:M42 family peptidase [Candidatus Poribacteria bacterium]